MTSRFGRTQLRIMLVLWEKGQATAHEIMNVLSQNAPIAESTVRTILSRLEKKGAIRHDVEGRTFVFRPLKSQEDVVRNGTRELIEYLFDDSPGELISHLLDRQHFTPQEKEMFRAILEKPSTSGSPHKKKTK